MKTQGMLNVMALRLESAAKDFNDEWVCDEVPDAVIQDDKLYRVYSNIDP